MCARRWVPKKKTATNGGFADCQRIVTEQELPALLAEGWRVAAVLPSGKVVVSSERLAQSGGASSRLSKPVLHSEAHEE